MNKLLAPEGKNKAYEIMMKREGRVKPASTTFRREIIEKQRRANYINEYDRLNGEIESYANNFSRPGSSHIISRLKSRQDDLKELFKQSHHEHSHPITHK
jgi:hypothetical protein